ncbi:UNVERIFIED_CONTAM: ABC transporter G family member 32 [Sesamum radiatum]|uniref:ABC transporter G family member 32 n=1 Tax=Sesamum radiatum TaxID=300843 RepID=A0AAW2L8D6_SESRA
MSVFCRATLHHDTVDDGGLYLGELYFSMVIILFNGFAEVSMLVAKLPILYKHRDLHFYPSWAYTIPSWFLSIPTSLIESGFWVAVTYYVVGFDPNITRFLRQFVLFFFLHQMSLGLFRLIGSLGRNMIVANTFGSFAMLIIMALGGYIISREKSFKQKGMVLPFQQVSMSFSNISYYVDVPLELKQQGISEDKLKLLNNITGAFRPGVLTALVGVSGAGKTTLMDVLAGRKTGGTIEGNISISGYPKRQETFARISGPQVTYGCSHSQAFVDEVMELVELIPLKGALVGLPGVDGLSTEQRKRLTIAVELVANPSIVFMDEPTSGLDARAAAIVMRTVRNIVNTGRTIVCTIQPSIDIFESSMRFNEELVARLGKPAVDSEDLNFPTKYSRSYFDQFVACLWKQHLSYWRNPQYTAVRFFYTVIISLMLGTICWEFGSKRDTQQDIFNAMGSMYVAVLFVGITNATAVQPVVSVERFVSYRERAAGTYSALPFAFAQALIYSTIFYSLASFEWAASKFLWYTFFMYFTMLYFTFYGMMTTAVTPNHNVAAIIAAPFYMLWNLFSGFMIPHKRIPIWWRWYYWANPVAWSLYGLVASQYSDSDRLVKLSDGAKLMSTKLLVKNVFGFRHDFIGIAGFMLVGFCMLFALIFAFAIKSFNFQRR